jgi:hypothetical protein
VAVVVLVLWVVMEMQQHQLLRVVLAVQVCLLLQVV